MGVAVVSGILVAALALVLLLPAVILAVQVLAGRRAHEATELSAASRRPRLAVLMPAHNEADGIAAALGPVMAQLLPGDRVLVVADNCSDDTAAVALACGAEVSLRYNTELRGKGYALDHGMRELSRQPPEVVVIVDADCQVDQGALDSLARLAQAQQRPVQAAYLMDAAVAESNLKLRVSQFAWRVKNLLRPRGMHRLGLPCQLTGSGMAFPWQVLASARLASSHLVEDLQLGLELARKGRAPVFCESASVRSVFPMSPSGLLAQRTRWEHGHLESIKAVPALLVRSMLRRDMRLFAMTLDVSVPPLALLLLSALAGILLSVAFWLLTDRLAPLIVAGVALAALVVAVFVAWHAVGLDLIRARELLSLPAYAIWKIPVYIKYVFDRQVEWVRSQRAGK